VEEEGVVEFEEEEEEEEERNAPLCSSCSYTTGSPSFSSGINR
jgi:hypothetical protein